MPAPPRDTLRQTGVLAWLTVYLVLLFAIPSRLIILPLGSAGAPSMLLGLASALVWLLVQLWRSSGGTSPRRPIRLALAVFLVSVAVSWSGVFLMAHDGLTRLRDVGGADLVVVDRPHHGRDIADPDAHEEDRQGE